MKTTELIPQIKIASPCHARWEDMTGDEHRRFCAHCQKQVYSFSSLSAVAVAELVQAREGKLCARFYRRRDGTMLTTDCPVGARKASLRLQGLLTLAAGLLVTSLGIRAWSNANDGIRPPGRFTQKFDSVLWTIKGWLGMQPPVMGMICTSPAPAASAPAPATPDQDSKP